MNDAATKTRRNKPLTIPAFTAYPETPAAEQREERAAEDAFWTALAARKGSR